MATWQETKDAWKVPLPDLEAFDSLLESTVRLLDLDGDSAHPGQRDIKRHLPNVQISLLTLQLPTFLPVLEPVTLSRVKSLFAPERTSRGLSKRRQVALTTFRTVPLFFTAKPPVPLPIESRGFALDVMVSLVGYSVDDLYWAVYGATAEQESSREGSARSLEWEEAVGALVGVPAKVNNAKGRWKMQGETPEPDVLSSRIYFDNLTRRFEALLYELAQSRTSPTPLLHLLQRLGSLGLFTQTPKDDRAPSFWRSFLPTLLPHLSPNPTTSLPAYPDDGYLPRFFLALPASALNPLVDSLVHHLTWNIESLAPETPSKHIAQVGHVLNKLLGPAERGGEAFEAVFKCLIGVKGTHTHACSVIRGIVAWVGLSGQDTKVTLLQEIYNAWTDPQYIRFALYGQQFALTYTLLLCISLLDPFHPELVALSHRARFLNAMQTYLSHQDPSIRRLGMLVAEIVSERTIEDTDDATGVSEKDEVEELKAGLEAGLEGDARPPPRGSRRLRFGSEVWDGPGQGKDEARWLRKSVGVRDTHGPLDDGSLDDWYLGWDRAASTTPVDPPIAQPTAERRIPRKPPQESQARPKIVMLDEEQAEDTLEGYDPSSRSPSPTPSYLEEVAADPSLALDAAQKKITRPVYIAQLVALVKDRESPESVEMALKHGESLIRAKRSFGGELEENAVELSSMVIALDDPFHLDDFDEKRQGMLNALVACSPRNVAPYLSEIYFTGQFSLRKRTVILTALSMGARELAGLYTPTRRVDFPSKTLPLALHRKYAIEEDFAGQGQGQGQLEAAAEALRGEMLSQSAQKGQETLPARQRQLRVTRKTLVAERGTLEETQMVQRPDPVVPFQDVAAEYFILPLINHFWTYFNDATTREDRARARGDRYRSAGTGLVLSPLSLEKLLVTLVLLLHAARHSPLYLAVLAPEALELALGIATRHRAAPDVPEEQEGETGQGGAEAGVVSAALELCLVVLDTSVELDKGRTVVMAKPALVAAVGEWAGAVFQAEQGGGARLGGQGGLGEGRVRTTAAAVVVKVSEIAEKWGRYDVV